LAFQNETPFLRSIRRARKIRMRLGAGFSFAEPFPEKPSGMHRRTYLRMRAAAGESIAPVTNPDVCGAGLGGLGEPPRHRKTHQRASEGQERPSWLGLNPSQFPDNPDRDRLPQSARRGIKRPNR
jgi:hypothetical protein